jgi:hypothetical protein
MPTVDIDGIATHYAISGSGPPILMMAPGGFDSAIEKWSTTWPWQHFLPLTAFASAYTCIAYDRRVRAAAGGIAPGRAGAVAWPGAAVMALTRIRMRGICWIERLYSWRKARHSNDMPVK